LPLITSPVKTVLTPPTFAAPVLTPAGAAAALTSSGAIAKTARAHGAISNDWRRWRRRLWLKIGAKKSKSILKPRHLNDPNRPIYSLVTAKNSGLAHDWRTIGFPLTSGPLPAALGARAAGTRTGSRKKSNNDILLRPSQALAVITELAYSGNVVKRRPPWVF